MHYHCMEDVEGNVVDVVPFCCDSCHAIGANAAGQYTAGGTVATKAMNTRNGVPTAACLPGASPSVTANATTSSSTVSDHAKANGANTVTLSNCRAR